MVGWWVGGIRVLIIRGRCREYFLKDVFVCTSYVLSMLTCLSSLSLLSLIRYIDSSHTELLRIGSLDADKG